MTLQERLRRLRREDGPAPGAGLDALEADLVGTPGEGLSLKERLQRLVDVASRGRAPARRPVPIAIEEVVPGRVVRNERGEFFLVEHELHLETWHGDLSLSRINAVSSGSVEVLSGEPSLAAFDLRRAAFLDTETTGLAGGTGTAAFLVGVGFVDGEVFRVRQYFMRDYHEEPALLQALAEDLARFPFLVTYNGKMFDVPLLETRYRLCRQAPPLAEALHLDLLHPARRLWKARLESCRLQSLEDALLGLRRHGDLAGEEIPRIYFDYVRSRAAGVVPRILEHNRLDIVSLAALSILACQWVEEGWAQTQDPRDVYSLARVLERARLYERSEVEYRRTAEAGEGPLRVAAQMRLAARAWRNGDEEAAAALWRQAADAGEPLALRALAVDLEHRRRDPAGAFGHVERALQLLERRGTGGRVLVEMRRRRERLLRKLGAQAETVWRS